MLARKYALACDHLLELELVDYDGNVVIANQSYNSDLLWASKGGGGGNFGIITRFSLAVRLGPAVIQSVCHSRYSRVCTASGSHQSCSGWCVSCLRPLRCYIHPGHSKPFQSSSALELSRHSLHGSETCFDSCRVFVSGHSDT